MKGFRKNEQSLFICEECKLSFSSQCKLTHHINLHHNKKEYYDKWLKEENEGLCKICKKETEFRYVKWRGYKLFCKNCWSIFIKNCTTEDTVLKRKKTCKNIHGSETYNNMNKNKSTCLEKYGVDSVFKSKDIREKTKQTCREKFGVENPTQNIEIYKKQQQNALFVKKFRNTKIYYRGSYELDFLEKYYNKYPDIINAKSIKYKVDKKIKYIFQTFIFHL